MPRQGMFMTSRLWLWTVFFAIQLPAMGLAMEPIEGRWKTLLGPVQLEYRHGTYVARMLEDNHECGFALCSEVFRGKLGEDGVFIGVSRSCLPPECRAAGEEWVFAMGILSENDNRLDLVELAPRQKCKKRDIERHVVNVRQSLENVDCERLRLERRVPALLKQMRDAKKSKNFSQIQREVEALFVKHPDVPEVMHLQARLLLAEGSPASVAKAAETYELAEGIQPNARDDCGLAILNAKMKNIAEGIKHLRRCAQRGHLSCEEIAEDEYGPLRSHKEYREIRNALGCGGID